MQTTAMVLVLLDLQSHLALASEGVAKPSHAMFKQELLGTRGLSTFQQDTSCFAQLSFITSLYRVGSGADLPAGGDILSSSYPTSLPGNTEGASSPVPSPSSPSLIASS